MLAKAFGTGSARSKQALRSGLHCGGYCPGPWLSTQPETRTQDGQVWMKTLERRPLAIYWMCGWLLVTNLDKRTGMLDRFHFWKS